MSEHILHFGTRQRQVASLAWAYWKKKKNARNLGRESRWPGHD